MFFLFLFNDVDFVLDVNMNLRIWIFRLDLKVRYELVSIIFLIIILGLIFRKCFKFCNVLLVSELLYDRLLFYLKMFIFFLFVMVIFLFDG